jgi:hypothetical protein
VTTESVTIAMTANTEFTLGQGRIFTYVSGTQPVTITLQSLGTAARVRRLVNMLPGIKYRSEDDRGFATATVVTATAQTATFIVGDDDVETVGSVSVIGSASVSVIPATAISTPVRIAVPSGAQGLIIAANLLRKWVTLQVPSTDTVPVHVGATGEVSATRGFEITPGLAYEFRTTAAIYGWGVGGIVNVQIVENT